MSRSAGDARLNTKPGMRGAGDPRTNAVEAGKCRTWGRRVKPRDHQGCVTVARRRRCSRSGRRRPQPRRCRRTTAGGRPWPMRVPHRPQRAPREADRAGVQRPRAVDAAGYGHGDRPGRGLSGGRRWRRQAGGQKAAFGVGEQCLRLVGARRPHLGLERKRRGRKAALNSTAPAAAATALMTGCSCASSNRLVLRVKGCSALRSSMSSRST